VALDRIGSPRSWDYILMNPQSGVISLTFVFAIFFLVESVIETVLYFQIGKVGNSGMGSVNAYGTLSDSRRIVIESTR
jgi:hypothetical protein